MKRILCLTLLAVASGAIAADAPADSTAAPAEAGRITFYGLGYRDTPDFQVAGFTADFGPVAFADHDGLDLELSAPIEVYRYKGEDRIRFAADPLIGIGVMLPFIAVSELIPSSEPYVVPFAIALLPAWLPLVHPTLVLKPVSFAGLTLGWDSAYIFHAEDKGVTFEPRLGVRLEPSGSLRLEGGVEHGSFWNWRHANESLGWGWYARASLSTDLVGGAAPPPSGD